MATDSLHQAGGIKEPLPQPPSPCNTPPGTAEDLIQIRTLSVICHPKVPRPWIDTTPQNTPHSFAGPILPATEAPYHGLTVAGSSGPGGKGKGLGGAGNPP